MPFSVEVMQVEIAKLSPKVGDIIVAKVKNAKQYTKEDLAKLRGMLSDMRPKGVRVAIVGDDIEFSLIESPVAELPDGFVPDFKVEIEC